MERKQESFMRGAMILTVATLISRVIGAFYRPVVSRLFAPWDNAQGDVGMGLTQVPLNSYQLVLSFTSVGFNIAISRLVAERLARHDTGGAKRVFRISLWFMGISGAVASLVFWFGAPILARLTGWPDARPGFMAMAPALILVSVMATYRGLFQGFQRMTPNAVSQIYEQGVRVVTGMILVWLLVRRSVPLGAAGFNAGDGVGALAGLIYLLLLYRSKAPSLWAWHEVAATGEPLAPQAATREDSTWVIIKKIVAQAVPISLIGAVLPLIMWTDSFLVAQRLMVTGMKELLAQADYGRLTNSFFIINLPAVITTAIYVSLVPAIAEALAQSNYAQVRSRSLTAMRITLLFAIPASIGIFILADPIYHLIYPSAQGGPALQALAWGTLFLMVQQTTSGMLQGAGRVGLPVRNLFISVVVKVVLTYVLTGIPWLGVQGAALATVLAFATAALLNLWDLRRVLDIRLDLRSLVYTPLIAGVAMASAVYVGQLVLVRLFGHATLVALAMMVSGAAVYGVVLLPLGGLTEDDLHLVPGLGRRMVPWLKRLHLLRV